MLLLDQRGTGRSEPALNCFTASLRGCLDLLEAGGVDVQAYNTRENAADVNDIRLALGYGRLAAQAIKDAFARRNFLFQDYRYNILHSKMGRALRRRT